MKEYIGRIYVCKESYGTGLFGHITIPKGFKMKIIGIRDDVNLDAIVLEGSEQYPKDKNVGISPKTLRSNFTLVNNKIKRLE